MALAIVVGLCSVIAGATREASRRRHHQCLAVGDPRRSGRARLYEVIFNWDYYGQYPGKIVAVWEGGLAMHGGLIVGRWSVRSWRGDGGCRAARLRRGGAEHRDRQAIGRWGNFFNEEAFRPADNLPWKLYISPAHRPTGYGQFEYFHPTFLYESLWDFGVFVLWWPGCGPPARVPGRALLRVHRLYSDRALRHRGAPTRQLLGGQFRVPQLASLAGVIVRAHRRHVAYRRTRPAVAS